MIQSFKNDGTKDIFNGEDTKISRKTCRISVWQLARRKLDLLDSAIDLNELRIPPNNRLEALAGDRKGHYLVD